LVTGVASPDGEGGRGAKTTGAAILLAVSMTGVASVALRKGASVLAALRAAGIARASPAMSVAGLAGVCTGMAPRVISGTETVG